MVKKLLISAGFVAMLILAASCSRVRRSPGRTYMPDMVYSRAYETYASTEELQKKGVHYTGIPVEGTVARGDIYTYRIKNDSTGYIQSASITNPLPALSAKDYMEAARLYLINCGICHGAKLDGMGPLFGNGQGPFQAAPKNFMADDMKKLPEGTMFHSVTYGKGAMGSYASQLSSKQRWMIVHYIKEKQSLAGNTASTGNSDSTAKTTADSSKVK